MNKVYLFVHEAEDESKSYLVFSCLEAATEFATHSELEPFTAVILHMPIDTALEAMDHQYEWDGIKWNYARI